MPLVNMVAFIHMHYDFMNSFPREWMPGPRAQSTIHFRLSSLSLFLSPSDNLFGESHFRSSVRHLVPFSAVAHVCGLINMSCIRAHLPGTRSTYAGTDLTMRYNDLIKVVSRLHRTSLEVLKTTGILHVKIYAERPRSNLISSKIVCNQL